MRISDWSSDVCSSDLFEGEPVLATHEVLLEQATHAVGALSGAMGGRLGRADLRGDAGDLGLARSAERRVGNACVCTCRSWWSPTHENNYITKISCALSSNCNKTLRQSYGLIIT